MARTCNEHVSKRGVQELDPNWQDNIFDVLTVYDGLIKEGKIKKMTHGVKKIKGEYIKNICENWFTDIPDFWDDKIKTIEIIS